MVRHCAPLPTMQTIRPVSRSAEISAQTALECAQRLCQFTEDNTRLTGRSVNQTNPLQPAGARTPSKKYCQVPVSRFLLAPVLPNQTGNITPIYNDLSGLFSDGHRTRQRAAARSSHRSCLTVEHPPAFLGTKLNYYMQRFSSYLKEN